MEDGLFSEFPLTGYVIGLAFSDLLHDETVSIPDIQKVLIDDMNGRIPDSAKIFASIVDVMRESESIGKRKTASIFSDFEWKGLWKDGAPEEDAYAEWIAKYKLEFLFEDSCAGDDDDDNQDGASDVQVAKILSDGLGQSSVEDLINEIQVCIAIPFYSHQNVSRLASTNPRVIQQNLSTCSPLASSAT